MILRKASSQEPNQTDIAMTYNTSAEILYIFAEQYNKLQHLKREMFTKYDPRNR